MEVALFAESTWLCDALFFLVPYDFDPHPGSERRNSIVTYKEPVGFREGR